MEVTERKKTSYELHHSGHIFVEEIAELVDAGGRVVSTGQPTRTPHEPLQLRQDPPPKNDKDPGGPVKIVETDLSRHPDEKLRQLAALHWTPEIKAAHRARLEHQMILRQPAPAAVKGAKK